MFAWFLLNLSQGGRCLFLHGYRDDRRHKYLCHYRRADVFLAEW